MPRINFAQSALECGDLAPLFTQTRMNTNRFYKPPIARMTRIRGAVAAATWFESLAVASHPLVLAASPKRTFPSNHEEHEWVRCS